MSYGTDETDPKRLINSKLVKIKEEMSESINDTSSIYEDDDLTQEPCTQPCRPQQFYQDLDQLLDGLPRDTYVHELLNSCNYEISKIHDYRERLSERAKGFPDCPDSRLVKRRNSPNTSRERKMANDCYILYSFTQGERSREIFDVFVGGNVNEPIVLDKESTYLATPTLPPDTLTLLTNIQCELIKISTKQEQDSKLLRDVQNDVSHVTNCFKVVQGAVNSILARLPISDNTPQITKLQDNIDRLGSSLASMNMRFLDNPSVDIGLQTSGNATADNQTDASYALVVSQSSSPIPASSNKNQSKQPPVKKSTTTKNDNSTSSNVPGGEITRERAQSTDRNANHGKPTGTKRNNDPKNTNGNDRFIAARKPRNESYFLQNIDCNVVENDIYKYMTENGVYVSHIRIFYGKTGCSAKINIPLDMVHLIEVDDFWPNGITCRKWVPLSEWDQKKPRRNNRSRYDDRRYHYKEDDTDSASNYDYDTYSSNLKGKDNSRLRWFSSYNGDEQWN